jgi:hypothetical protein
MTGSDYYRIKPRFWTGETGKQIRSCGHHAQLVAMYLITCPSANALGLYYLPLPTLCHEVDISQQGALKALRSLSEVGFAHYDHAAEVVFVPEMARHQLGDELPEKDNRHKWVCRQLGELQKLAFFPLFYAKYKAPFHLPDIEGLERSFEAPSKPIAIATTTATSQQQQDQQRAAALRARFDRFWTGYPRKVKKASAVKSWERLVPDEELLEVMLAAIGRQRQSAQWQEERFIPYPTTWLNERRWEDETTAAAEHPAPIDGSGRRSLTAGEKTAAPSHELMRRAAERERGMKAKGEL